MGDQQRSDRLRRIEDIYHAALGVPPARRPEFLAGACANDSAVRSEVESLLAVTTEAGTFLEPTSKSLIGCQVGRYNVTALIGSGGMGQVYRATDTRLGRDVALKVLSDTVGRDPDRVRRFEQEARSAAALNHPNILAVFDVGTHEGAPYLISELLEGRTLRAHIEGGACPLDRAVDYTVQIARGLAAAHDKGIVHRDVKPENVFVTADGHVKLLDFGVAKLLEEGPLPRAVGDMRVRSTAEGTLIGTVGYMSPEQVRGQAVDHRSDVFAVGAVLYEMATGHRAFERETAADTLAAILDEEPEYEKYASSPPRARALAVARRCLEKRPQDRYQACRDIALVLEDDVATATRSSHTHILARWSIAAAAIALVLLALVVWLRRDPGPAGSPAIRSLAVLPLKVLSHGAEDEYFADSMTEALTHDLAKISALRVVSRTSVMRYKQTQALVPQIGRELGVDAVVEGSIERVGNRVRISAQLIRAATDEHLWAEKYDRDMRDVLRLQDEVARTIAREVRVTLTPDEHKRLQSAREVDPEAYQLYVKGRYFWDKKTEESVNRSIDYFRQAIDRDPGYAAAYTGLADAYVSLGFSFDVGSLPPADAIPKAKAAAMKALSLDESLAEAHTSLGHIRLHYDWDWPAAEAEFLRALELNPGYAQAHHWYSHFLVASGRLEESLVEANRALELDLLSPTMNVHVGWNHFFAREYELALTQFAKTLELAPDYGLAHWYRGMTYAQQRKYSDALGELRRSAELLKGNVIIDAAMGQVRAASGNRAEAARLVAALQEEGKRRYINPFEIALIYVSLDERDRAFEWLDRAYRQRADLLVYLETDPRLDPLRADPRFQTLVEKIGIPSR